MIEIPIWIPGFNGNFSIGDIDIEGSGKIKDLLSQFTESKVGLDYYFVGKFGVTIPKWHFQADVYGAKLNSAVAFTSTQAVIKGTELTMVIPRIFAGYNLYKHVWQPLPRQRKFEIWPYAGLRFIYVHIFTVYDASLPESDTYQNWIDPLVGFNLHLQLNRFRFYFENDFGGFSIGTDFSYLFQLSAEYQASKLLSIKAGWIYQSIKFSTQKRRDLHRYNVTMSGPLLGFIFSF